MISSLLVISLEIGVVSLVLLLFSSLLYRNNWVLRTSYVYNNRLYNYLMYLLFNDTDLYYEIRDNYKDGNIFGEWETGYYKMVFNIFVWNFDKFIKDKDLLNKIKEYEKTL